MYFVSSPLYLTIGPHVSEILFGGGAEQSGSRPHAEGAGKKRRTLDELITQYKLDKVCADNVENVRVFESHLWTPFIYCTCSASGSWIASDSWRTWSAPTRTGRRSWRAPAARPSSARRSRCPPEREATRTPSRAPKRRRRTRLQ